jgi:hypothetical protein
MSGYSRPARTAFPHPTAKPPTTAASRTEESAHPPHSAQTPAHPPPPPAPADSQTPPESPPCPRSAESQPDELPSLPQATPPLPGSPHTSSTQAASAQSEHAFQSSTCQKPPHFGVRYSTINRAIVLSSQKPANNYQSITGNGQRDPSKTHHHAERDWLRSAANRNRNSILAYTRRKKPEIYNLPLR